ncbi:hypothetical protein BGZ83_009711 [Gryganskiella cystojenkinii]|nr:hypothetical protein BGZ83_009711 [Gryganskiella cystojenkinii]
MPAWTALPLGPPNAYHSAGYSSENTSFITFGRDTAPKDPSMIPPHFVNIYNITTKTWTGVDPVQVTNNTESTRRDFVAVTNPQMNKIYFTGGDMGPKGATFASNFNTWNPIVNTMTVTMNKPPGPWNISTYAATWVPSQLSMYIIGGVTSSSTLPPGLWVYHANPMSWTVQATTGPFNQARISACAATSSDSTNILVYGGFIGGKGDGDNAVYILDMSTWVWTAYPQPSGSKGRGNVVCTIAGDTMLIWGGFYTSPNVLNDTPLGAEALLLFSVSKKSWITTYTPTDYYLPPPPPPSGSTIVSSTPVPTNPGGGNSTTDSTPSTSPSSQGGLSDAAIGGLAAAAVAVLVLTAFALIERQKRLQAKEKESQRAKGGPPGYYGTGIGGVSSSSVVSGSGLADELEKDHRKKSKTLMSPKKEGFLTGLRRPGTEKSSLSAHPKSQQTRPYGPPRRPAPLPPGMSPVAEDVEFETIEDLDQHYNHHYRSTRPQRASPIDSQEELLLSSRQFSEPTSGTFQFAPSPGTLLPGSSDLTFSAELKPLQKSNSNTHSNTYSNSNRQSIHSDGSGFHTPNSTTNQSIFQQNQDSFYLHKLAHSSNNTSVTNSPRQIVGIDSPFSNHQFPLNGGSPPRKRPSLPNQKQEHLEPLPNLKQELQEPLSEPLQLPLPPSHVAPQRQIRSELIPLPLISPTTNVIPQQPVGQLSPAAPSSGMGVTPPGVTSATANTTAFLGELLDQYHDHDRERDEKLRAVLTQAAERAEKHTSVVSFSDASTFNPLSLYFKDPTPVPPVPPVPQVAPRKTPISPSNIILPGAITVGNRALVEDSPTAAHHSIIPPPRQVPLSSLRSTTSNATQQYLQQQEQLQRQDRYV